MTEEPPIVADKKEPSGKFFNLERAVTWTAIAGLAIFNLWGPITQKYNVVKQKYEVHKTKELKEDYSEIGAKLKSKDITIIDTPFTPEQYVQETTKQLRTGSFEGEQKDIQQLEREVSKHLDNGYRIKRAIDVVNANPRDAGIREMKVQGAYELAERGKFTDGARDQYFTAVLNMYNDEALEFFVLKHAKNSNSEYQTMFANEVFGELQPGQQDQLMKSWLANMPEQRLQETTRYAGKLMTPRGSIEVGADVLEKQMGEVGQGWISEGVQKIGELYDMVKGK